MKRLLQPWLGDQADQLGVTLPDLVAVSVQPDIRPNLSELAERLQKASPGAAIDDHAQFNAGALNFLRTIEVLALSLLGWCWWRPPASSPSPRAPGCRSIAGSWRSCIWSARTIPTSRASSRPRPSATASWAPASARCWRRRPCCPPACSPPAAAAPMSAAVKAFEPWMIWPLALIPLAAVLIAMVTVRIAVLQALRRMAY